MTTAHRPTWKAAVGKASEGGYSQSGGLPSSTRSILDAPSHTKLKMRSDVIIESSSSSSSAAASASRREEILKQSLEKIKDMEERKKKKIQYGQKGIFMNDWRNREIDEKVEEEGRRKLLLSENDVDEVKLKRMYDDEDEEIDNEKKIKKHDDDVEDFIHVESDLDASDSDASDSDDDDSDDDDSDDEEDLLQAELAKIRAERERAKEKAEEEARLEEQSKMEEAALIGNPLLNVNASSLDGIGAGGGKMKRKWNDDVVFRNQAKGEPEQNKKRFINDTIRNDFHKRFLNKFIR